MQSLYYNSGSGITSSLLLIKENGTPEVWTNNTITNLIISGALGEILAYSGSNIVVSFPIDNTNIYYGIDYNEILSPGSQPFAPPPVSSPPPPIAATTRWSFGFANIDPDMIFNDWPTYYISSSDGGDFYYIASGSSATGSELIFINSTGSYEIAITSSNGTLPSYYTSSIQIYNSTTGSTIPGIPGTLLYDLSGSSNVPLTASLFLSASNSYNIIMFIQGNYYI